MELKTKLEQLYQRIEEMKDVVKTEEATKTAFIMPFIQILGYDIFNPTEVIPEFVADIGTKKGEKVDYLIMQNKKPAIIIECKHWKEKPEAHNSQLHRYYHVSNARFGIMTNGIIYNFFTDLESANIMDDKPFLSIDLSDLKDSSIKEIEKFSNQSFDISNILDSAEALKYIKAIRFEFEKELQEQSDDFIKLLVARFFDKPITANRLEMFKGYAKKAISSSINDIVNSRLKSALSISQEEEQEEEDIIEIEPSRIITTEEELEAFQIVKAILREVLSGDRITHRDTQSYFGILLDDNNRKPICRFRFGEKINTIELFHNGKSESERVQIECLEDIYKYKEELLKTIENY